MDVLLYNLMWHKLRVKTVVKKSCISAHITKLQSSEMQYLALVYFVYFLICEFSSQLYTAVMLSICKQIFSVST